MKAAPTKGLKLVTKLWIGIGMLAVLSPLGLIIPALFKADTAWGEWGLDTIRRLAGFVPEGMKRHADTWKAPMPGYAVPGSEKVFAEESFGYLLAGIIGIVLAAGLMFLLAKLLVRNKDGR
jgi:hypothetical protein